ncbi:clasp N terminal-domain-containing protein [Aspergillus egyptiacus]|nr:clasp N terminal-domain-containing protein [Aspergillus egyptiacus]
MEPKAKELLLVLKNPNLSVDAKISHLLALKSDIKQKNVPGEAVESIVKCLHLSIVSHHVSLLVAGFSTLGHFLKRMFIQNMHGLVVQHVRQMYPSILDRLGDHKDRIRDMAAKAFAELHTADSAEVEHNIFSALTGKNPRAKQASLTWLSEMCEAQNLRFRSYVPSIVACLEDADSAVRDTAKSTIVKLFENASAKAKSDLKDQLAEHNVRKSITNTILASIGLDGDYPATESVISRPASRAAHQPSRPPSRGDALHNRPTRPPSRGDALHPKNASRMTEVSQQPAHPPSRGDALLQENSIPTAGPSQPSEFTPSFVFTTSLSEVNHATGTPRVVKPVPMRPNLKTNNVKHDQSKGHKAAGTPGPARPTPRREPLHDDNVRPLDVYSAREIEDMVKSMAPHFEGKESEQNWPKREQHIQKLRQLTYGNAPHEYPEAYVAAIKSLLDGILNVAASLRTTLSALGCLMVQDMAHACGTQLDSSVDIIMPSMMKVCSSTKKITAENGNMTVEVLLENLTCNSRLLGHITAAAQERNIQLRLYGAGWLKLVINSQDRRKTTPDCLAKFEACIKKSLVDANPAVREAMRSTFWAYYEAFPVKAKK